MGWFAEVTQGPFESQQIFPLSICIRAKYHSHWEHLKLGSQKHAALFQFSDCHKMELLLRHTYDIKMDVDKDSTTIKLLGLEK